MCACGCVGVFVRENIEVEDCSVNDALEKGRGRGKRTSGPRVWAIYDQGAVRTEWCDTVRQPRK